MNVYQEKIITIFKLWGKGIGVGYASNLSDNQYYIINLTLSKGYSSSLFRMTLWLDDIYLITMLNKFPPPHLNDFFHLVVRHLDFSGILTRNIQEFLNLQAPRLMMDHVSSTKVQLWCPSTIRTDWVTLILSVFRNHEIRITKSRNNRRQSHVNTFKYRLNMNQALTLFTTRGICHLVILTF